MAKKFDFYDDLFFFDGGLLVYFHIFTLYDASFSFNFHYFSRSRCEVLLTDLFVNCLTILRKIAFLSL